MSRSVDVDPLVDVCVDAALDNAIGLHVGREADLSGLAGFHEENIVVCDAVYGESGSSKGDRLGRVLVDHVVLVL